MTWTGRDGGAVHGARGGPATWAQETSPGATPGVPYEVTRVDKCEVCGQPYHSETARAVAQVCRGCKRVTCPDCLRIQEAEDGRGIGRWCRECADAAAAEVARIGVMLRYRPAYVGQRDAAGVPLRRAELQQEQVSFGW